MTPSSHLTPVNGMSYHYLRWGDERSPAVLMLHGLRSYARTWEPVAHALSSTHLVIAPDFRGRGESSWDPKHDYFTTTYVRDIEDLVAQLGLTRFSIVGHSMGGAVGYAYAARRPEQVDRLVIEDIGPDSSTATAGADRIVREMSDTPDSFDSLDAVRGYWHGIRPGITEDALASRIQHTIREAPDGRWHWNLDMTGIAKARLSGDPAGSIDLWACVEALRCPTLVVRGAQSDFLPKHTCERMAWRQPLVTWTEIPGAGHYVHDDNPAAFIRLVTGFLS
ncbi:pimeloyl-ACP methyl ester carboxylesterase [Kibdelosporangium banguiense]|uniref:Pimeloyl-ACP methyl ester carboxylesterase n=1 Tax=Kibdelosporangium banguiense TaxID=1365924 RepID=A0ABS4TUW4_9PSEU|nr:alpha/beta hydrolase [Kibdelosporangium banguiense]MBP2328204.1 pimeloyl-ACP methyl ester carboxylesterase [Kibdelosporangium banguiense]